MLNSSYRYCQQLTQRTAANFYPAFLVLPRRERRSMEALYAFLRVTDDLADSPGELTTKMQRLQQWRTALLDAINHQQTSHPLHAALVDTIGKHQIPLEYLLTVIDGVASDQQAVSFESFAELYHYCYQVASVVGLACIHIWGFNDSRAPPLAESAGVAFQLTNILRDLVEDRSNGRIYLPAEDCRRFACPPESWDNHNQNFRDLMQFQVDRARHYYAEGQQLLPLLSPSGRAIFGAMVATYRGLLNEIQSRDFDVFTQRVSLSRFKKVSYLLRAFPVRWGWLR